MLIVQCCAMWDKMPLCDTDICNSLDFSQVRVVKVYHTPQHLLTSRECTFGGGHQLTSQSSPHLWHVLLAEPHWCSRQQMPASRHDKHTTVQAAILMRHVPRMPACMTVAPDNAID